MKKKNLRKVEFRIDGQDITIQGMKFLVLHIGPFDSSEECIEYAKEVHALLGGGEFTLK